MLSTANVRCWTLNDDNEQRSHPDAMITVISKCHRRKITMVKGRTNISSIHMLTIDAHKSIKWRNKSKSECNIENKMEDIVKTTLLIIEEKKNTRNSKQYRRCCEFVKKANHHNSMCRRNLWVGAQWSDRIELMQKNREAFRKYFKGSNMISCVMLYFGSIIGTSMWTDEICFTSLNSIPG